MTTPTSVSAVRPLRRSRLRADRLISSEIFIAVLCFQRGQCLGLFALAYHDHDDHDGHCCCGHHHHHHDHDADEVFTSWGVETAKKFSKADIEHALTELDTGNYGMILRSKGIVDGGADGWLEFDYVPGEWEVRQRGADVGGKLVVIGSKLDEKAIAALFGC